MEKVGDPAVCDRWLVQDSSRESVEIEIGCRLLHMQQVKNINW